MAISRGDTEVGVAHNDLSALHTLLAAWDLYVAAAGQLTPSPGEPLDIVRHQNNVWCRLTSDGPWVLDVTISERSDQKWMYRRDRSVVVPWRWPCYEPPTASPIWLRSTKDEVDVAEVIPSLDARQRELLSRLLRGRSSVAASPLVTRQTGAFSATQTSMAEACYGTRFRAHLAHGGTPTLARR